MIETIRRSDGEILDESGSPLRQSAEILRTDQRLRYDDVKVAGAILAKNTDTLFRLSRGLEADRSVEASKAHHNVPVIAAEVIQQAAQNIQEDYDSANAKREEILQAYGNSLDRYKARTHDAHEHFVVNGGNQGPYVDAALEDANAEMERRGEPPVNRTQGVTTGEMHSRDVWRNLGAQFSAAGEWMTKHPVDDKLHGMAFFTDQVTSDYMAQGKTQEEARELAYAAAQAVIAVQSFEPAA